MNTNKSRAKNRKKPTEAPSQKRPLSFLRRLPFVRFWLPAGVLFTALASVPSLYSSLPGIGLQQGVLIVTSIRACISWLVAVGVPVLCAAVLIRERKKALRQYPPFLQVVCWFGTLCLPVVLLAAFKTPQVSYDLARYYVLGAIDERETRVASTQETCRGGRTGVCTLRIDLEDGSRYSLRGDLADAIKEHDDIEAVRVLPLSRRLIGVRTKDGWL